MQDIGSDGSGSRDSDDVHVDAKEEEHSWCMNEYQQEHAETRRDMDAEYYG